MKWKSNININTVLWFVGLIFLAGGGWYALQVGIPNAIDQTNARFEQHMQNEFYPQQARVNNNAFRINSLEESALKKSDMDGFATKQDLESLKELVREIQNSQTQQLNNINSRLEYLIKRMDASK